MECRHLRRMRVQVGLLLAIIVVGVGGAGTASGAFLSTGVLGSESIDGESRHQICSPTLGHEPPGRTPEVFAPELLSRSGHPLHGALAISPAGDRLCWSVLPPAIICTHCQDGDWTDPEPLPLPGRGVQAPAFSPDGHRLYFQAAGSGGFGSLDIWWVDLRRGDWTTAVNIGRPVNSPGVEGQPTLTEAGELFYSGSMAGVEYGRGIFHALPVDGGYGVPQALGDAVNTPGIDFYPFVTPDGETLLFASNRGRTGEELTIHVSYRTPGDDWTEPVDVHPFMDFPRAARFPSISPDGRFLFFWSEGKIWWVDSGVLPKRGVK